MAGLSCKVLGLRCPTLGVGNSRQKASTPERLAGRGRFTVAPFVVLLLAALLPSVCPALSRAVSVLQCRSTVPSCLGASLL